MTVSCHVWIIKNLITDKVINEIYRSATLVSHRVATSRTIQRTSGNSALNGFMKFSLPVRMQDFSFKTRTAIQNDDGEQMIASCWTEILVNRVGIRFLMRRKSGSC